MNIKSLILGSAAALVAGGAAQAADLPVAEPVDYVKICDMYGAGYHYIPGTDTCLSIRGYVRAEARFYERFGKTGRRADKDAFTIYAKGVLKFTAKEETELGTLVGYLELEGDAGSDTKWGKAWLSLGGFYAGYITSASAVDYVGGMYLGDYDLGDTTVGAIGYNADLGNGVSFHVAIENEKTKTELTAAGAVGVPTAIVEDGQEMPAFAAKLKVAQAWGGVSLGGVVRQVNYLASPVNNDLGWGIAAGGEATFDAFSAAINAVYAEGALGYVGFVAGNDASVAGKLNDAWGVSGQLKYAFADNAYALVAAGYGEYDDNSFNANDYDQWQATFEVGYKPVANLQIKAAVLYTDTDYRGRTDIDKWEGKIRLDRNF